MSGAEVSRPAAPGGGAADRLREALGGPELAWLWPRAADRLERLGHVGGTVSLAGRTRAERHALNAVLRERRLGLDARTLSLAVLDGVLRESALAVGLPDAVETLLGRPLRDLPAERAHARARTAAMWEAAVQHEAVARHPGLREWLRGVRRSGRLSRRAPGGEGVLLADCLEVLARLPLAEWRLLSTLAGEVASRDNHTLDDGTALGALVLSALGHLQGLPPTSASNRRRLWESMGVLRDRLSSQVLVLGLRGAGDSPLASLLDVTARAGEPAVITLSMAERWLDAMRWPATDVFVCENPQVMTAAAARLGDRCAPIVCVAGNLSIAAMRLLRSLSAAGCRLRVHADFDPGGLGIAGAILQLPGAATWRFDERCYAEAVQRGRAGDEIEGDVRLPATPLGDALVSAGVAVYEESVVEDLLADLALSSAGGSSPGRGISIP